MGVGNISVEASIMSNGKLVRGTLTLFNDEYVFGNIRKTVNWEFVSIEQGIIQVKSLLRSIDKNYLVFVYNGSKSVQFVMESQSISDVVSKIREFANDSRNIRLNRENQKRMELEETRIQAEREQKIREEAQRKADEEYIKKQELEKKKKAEEEQRLIADKNRKIAEKEFRIKSIISSIDTKTTSEMIEVNNLSKKAGRYFIDNPYRVLGISCTANNEEANAALDKLKKLSRLKALESYKSLFDITGLEKPNRDLSIAQNSLTRLKDFDNKWFWYSSSDACVAWNIGKYRIELAKDGFEFGSYDLFLANYMYAIICDSNFNVSETWKRVLNYYCYICEKKDYAVLSTRFNDNELKKIDDSLILQSFQKCIFKPILDLCDRDDLDAIIRLHKILKDCNNDLLNDLSRKVVSMLVSWFTDKESDVMRFLKGYEDIKEPLSDSNIVIRDRGEEYCRVVEPVFEMVLRDFRGDKIRYNMIKESYKNTTYQLMFILYKLNDKSNAIYFANKCYSYCKPDDKKRIQNTFGEVNIKAIDWNIPHTSWDIKGDSYYYGRGCSVDFTQALYWYHKAAEAGNMYSQHSIGICYQKGNGVPQNDEQAVEWFRKACENGNPDGAFDLAECYYKGNGVRKDIDQSLKYWSKAAKMGHPSAQKRYDEVFSVVQIKRRNHRANNHICHDLGFQMTTGPKLVVEVSLNKPAYAYLVNAQGYQNYLNGSEFSFYGGYSTNNTYKIIIPSSNHWYVIVDCGEETIEGLVSSAKVKNA